MISGDAVCVCGDKYQDHIVNVLGALLCPSVSGCTFAPVATPPNPMREICADCLKMLGNHWGAPKVATCIRGGGDTFLPSGQFAPSVATPWISPLSAPIPRVNRDGSKTVPFQGIDRVNPDIAHCDTCKSDNAFQAAANQPNGAFRCGQCRALRPIFT